MGHKLVAVSMGLVFAILATSAGAQKLNTDDQDAYVTEKFGIGTASTPARDATIYESGTGSAVLMFQNGTTGTTALDGFYFGTSGAGEGYLWNYEDKDLYFATNNTTRMVIKNSGRVGIGTTAPANDLVVASPDSSGSGAAFQNSTTGYTGGDGLYFGIGSAEEAYLFNFEATDLYLGTSGSTRMIVKSGGNVGIGTTTPSKLLDVAGEAKCDVLNIAGADLCEHFDVRVLPGKGKAEPGTVVSIDVDNPGGMVVSAKAYDRTVAGVISGAGGLSPGVMMAQDDATRGDHPVALTGRVYCKVDATRAPVVPGDLLTTSDTPGHAMKVIDYARAQGAILGKAMTPLTEGQGLVLVLVTLQ